MATRIKDFSGAGSYTWICPGGVTAVHILAVGGGGGGGGGYEGFNGVTSARASGGCGGGGAIPTTAFVSVIPGGTYDITIGDGGDGGYGGNAGGNPISGYDGENTIFKLTGPVASLLTALGGGGGRHGVRYSENGTNLFVSIGGSPYNGVTYGTPSSSNASMSFGTNAIYKYDVPPIPYGGGGFFAGNSTNNKAFNGGSSQYNGFGIGGFSGSGGSAGANGTTSGSYLGGIGGGGRGDGGGDDNLLHLGFLEERRKILFSQDRPRSPIFLF
jgi:hypothetical protein